jgi:RNA polymerase sigma-70 factor (ECF subfamily)
VIEPQEERRILALLRGSSRERDRGLHDLFGRLRAPLFGLALRMTGRPDLADDAVQDTFVDVLGGLKGFRGDARLTTWLFRIAVRASARVAGRARQRAEVLPAELLDQAAGPPEAAARTDAAARILRAIVALPPAQRAVVSLMALDELSQTEVAEVLGIPVGTVYSRLHEARARLRGSLDRR